mmetsp:Transcript_5438/g.11821  ORF Transcript_5438/g.11821 Transcript_5438/m.11821 type:complete len:178 (+) Transcript_5438:172-705(+)
MAIATIDRVRKHRAKTNSTPEGREMLKAKGREYKRRSRRKLRINILIEEKSKLKNALHPDLRKLVDNEAIQYRNDLVKEMSKNRAPSRDEQQTIDIKVLEIEIEMMKGMRKRDDNAHRLRRGPNADAYVLPITATSNANIPGVGLNFDVSTMGDLFEEDILEALALFLDQDHMMAAC